MSLLLELSACKLPEPEPLPDLRPLRLMKGDPFADLQIAIAPILVAQSPELAAAVNERKLAANRDKIAQGLLEVLGSLGFKQPQVLPPVEGAVPGREAGDQESQVRFWCEEAAQRGADLLLEVEIFDYRIAWRGLTRLSPLAHSMALMPPFWPLELIRDELYSASYRIRCRYYLARRGTLLAESSVYGYAELFLNDFDRGWSFLPPFMFITDLVEEETARRDKGLTRLGPYFPWEGHVEKVESACEPYARRALQARFSDDLWQTLEPKVASAQFHKLLATKRGVVVGVDFAKRKYASRDARAVYAWLTAPAPSGGGLPEQNVTLLCNGEATAERILHAIEETSRRSRSEDGILVFFSGEGRAVSRRGGSPDLFLLPFDADAEALHKTGIDLRAEVRDKIAAPSRQSNLLLDVSFKPIGEEGPGQERIVEALQEIVNLSGGRPISLWLAAAPGTYANELESCSQGLFTHLLLLALGGAADSNEDREIDSLEIERYLREHLQRYVRSFNLQEQATLLLPEEGQRIFLGLDAPETGRQPRRGL